MNKRIEELAKEAGTIFPGTLLIAEGRPAVEFPDIDMFEKFVKLIVQECLTTITDQSTLDTNEDFREGFSHGRKLAWMEIRNKFGVK